MRLDTQRLQTLDQIREFLADSPTARPAAADPGRGLRVSWPRPWNGSTTPAKGRPTRACSARFLVRVAGLSRAQVTRLLRQHRTTGAIADRRGPRRPFPRRYTKADIGLLAEVDALHGTLSGPATRQLCIRALHVFGDHRFEHLAAISNGHLYNLRHSTSYRRRRGTMPATTRPVHIAIGERRRPRPAGQPGYLRVDTVHQGDLDGIKGLYHLNLVGRGHPVPVRRLTRAHRDALPRPRPRSPAPGRSPSPSADSTPTTVRSSSTARVAALLQALHIDEFTKSRPRRSNDNALVESKNGSVIRKHLGYGHIPSRYAERVNAFTQQVLSPYLNFHRPCLFPVEVVDAKGRVRKRYPHANVMTPYEKLKSLPNAADCLKPGTSFDELDAVAAAMSDNDAARALNQARDRLFAAIDPPPEVPRRRAALTRSSVSPAPGPTGCRTDGRGGRRQRGVGSRVTGCPHRSPARGSPLMPPPGCVPCSNRVAAGRPACQRAPRVLRCATALRVTHRPARNSDCSYGPCGPAWTGRPGRPRRLTGRRGRHATPSPRGDPFGGVVMSTPRAPGPLCPEPAVARQS